MSTEPATRYCIVHDSAEDPGGWGRVCLRWLLDESVPAAEQCQFDDPEPTVGEQP